MKTANLSKYAKTWGFPGDACKALAETLEGAQDRDAIPYARYGFQVYRSPSDKLWRVQFVNERGFCRWLA